MEPFPKEAEQVDAILASLATEFDIAERLYRYWLRTPKDSRLNSSILSPHVIDVAMLLNLQALRLFRASVELCQRSEAFAAGILTRSLFETLLALFFVLKRRVCVIVEPKRGTTTPVEYVAKLPSKKRPVTQSDWLSRDLRAWLYVAHGMYENELLLDKCGKTPGLRRVLRIKKLRTDAAQRAEIEQRIGPEWAFVLQNKSSFSGLSVADLAAALDLKKKPVLYQWYRGVYHIHSRMAHGGSALRHAMTAGDGSIRPRLLSTQQDVHGTLQAAIAIFFLCPVTIQKEIGLGPAVGMVLDAFERQIREAAKR
jgi:hypothetical protein